jgi:hypothetical protein
MVTVVVILVYAILGTLWLLERNGRVKAEKQIDTSCKDAWELRSQLSAVKEEYAHAIVELETTKRNYEQIKVSKEVPIPAIIRAKTAAEVRKAFEKLNQGEEDGI